MHRRREDDGTDGDALGKITARGCTTTGERIGARTAAPTTRPQRQPTAPAPTTTPTRGRNAGDTGSSSAGRTPAIRARSLYRARPQRQQARQSSPRPRDRATRPRSKRARAKVGSGRRILGLAGSEAQKFFRCEQVFSLPVAGPKKQKGGQKSRRSAKKPRRARCSSGLDVWLWRRDLQGALMSSANAAATP